MSDAALDWTEAPSPFKSRLRNLLLREHIGFNEGVRVLRRVFSYASRLPKLRSICIRDFSLCRDDIELNYIGLSILPQYLRKLARELDLDQVPAEEWQEDTKYIVNNHCVDTHRRLDLTIATTVAALSASRDWVVGQNLKISVSLSDVSFQEYWERRTVDQEVIAWRRTEDADYDPAFNATTLDPMCNDSKLLLGKMLNRLLALSGSRETATDLVRHVSLPDCTGSTHSLGYTSAMTQHIIKKARSTTSLYISGHEPSRPLPYIPFVSQHIAQHLAKVTFQRMHFRESVVVGMLAKLASVRKLKLDRVEFATNSCKRVFHAISLLTHLEKFRAERICVAKRGDGSLMKINVVDEGLDGFSDSVRVSGQENISVLLQGLARMLEVTVYRRHKDYIMAFA